MSRKKSKKSRTNQEILKAQGKIGKEIIEKKRKKDYELPLKQIKKDLIRTGFFAIISVILICLLAKYDINYNKVILLFRN